MNKYIIPVLLSVSFFLVGLFTINDYGINWDAPFRMLRGQIYLDQILHTNTLESKEISSLILKPGTFATRFDSLEGEEGAAIKLPERVLFKQEKGKTFYNDIGFKKYFMDELGGHPPLVDILAAATNRIFFGTLSIAGDLASYQIIYLLLASLGIFFVSIFAFELTNSYVCAFVAGICLSLFPLFFAEAHINMKDPITASFFTGSIWAFWHYVKENKLKWFLWFGIFIIISLSIKWNIIFIPIILFLWLISIFKTAEFKSWFNIWRLILSGFLLIIAVAVFLFAIWPPAWGNPFLLINVIKWYASAGINADTIAPIGFKILGFNFFPAFLVIVQTPEIILLIALFGIIALYLNRKKDNLKIWLLLLLWIIIPILRVGLPQFWFYNGIRQIMEVIPAIAIIAGIGAGFIVFRFKKLLSKIKYKNNVALPVFRVLVCFIALIFLIIPIIKYHPNENVYFNSFVGGFSGISKNIPVEYRLKLTFGNSYKQAADWLNKYAPKNSNVALLYGSQFALSPVMLRSDISISPYHFSGFDQKGEYLIMRDGSSEVQVFAAQYPEKILIPIYRVKVDGYPVLSVYKNSPEFVKSEYRKIEQSSDFKISHSLSNKGTSTNIILPKTAIITGIILSNNRQSCARNLVNYSDEAITFDETENGYEYLERVDRGENSLEIMFPAVKAKVIKIIPRDIYSCFLGGKIIAVKYIDLSQKR